MNQRALSPAGTVRQHSGWLVPLFLLAAILGLCGLFLGWYLRPWSRTDTPTGDSGLVTLTIKGVSFSVPANYLEGRAGSDGFALAALFPSMRGYSDREARLFAGNAPDSPVIHLSLHRDANGLDAGARLTRLYLPYVTGVGGMASAFDLTRYAFRPDSGYARDELFTGRNDEGLLLLLCERASPDFPSPNCIAIDRPVAPGVSLSYRFKRAWLGRWREMASGANALVERFRDGS